MATIVQPYNPWREQLAASIITPLLGDMIQRSREANQNRKQNALIGQIAQQVEANNAQGSLFANPATPEGYNADPWANAFHNNYTPLSQFDMGTASLVSPFGRQTQQQNIPTPFDYQKALATNLADKRFSMLDPTAMQGLLAPLIQSNEQARLEGLRNSAADEIKNATDSAARRNLLYGAAVNGLVPWDAVAQGQREYERDTISPFQQRELDYKDRALAQEMQRWITPSGDTRAKLDHDRWVRSLPQQVNVDAGGSSVLGSYSPITGYNMTNEISKTLTPNEQLNAERPIVSTYDAGDRWIRGTVDPNTGELINREEIPKGLDPNRTQTANNNQFKQSEIQYKTLQDRRKSLQTQLDEFTNELPSLIAIWGDDSSVILAQQQRIDELKKEIDSIDKQATAIFPPAEATDTSYISAIGKGANTTTQAPSTPKADNSTKYSVEIPDEFVYDAGRDGNIQSDKLLSLDEFSAFLSRLFARNDSEGYGKSRDQIVKDAITKLQADGIRIRR